MKTNLSKCSIALGVIALVTAIAWNAPSAFAQEEKNSRSAKDLYYDPGIPTPPPGIAPPPPPASGYIGLKYQFILMDLDGDIREVTERFRFSTGDRFRIVFETNIHGYVYIFHKGTSSRGVLLFPDARIKGGTNYLTPHTRYSVPEYNPNPNAQGWFKFDGTIGTEQLFIMVSPTPIAQFSNCVPGRECDQNAWDHVVRSSKSAPKPDSRDIYYEAPGSSSGAPSANATTGYVVGHPPILTHFLPLTHIR